MKKLVLIGGGGHCRSCIDVIERQAEFEIVGIVDNQLSRTDKVMGYSVIGTDDDLTTLVNDVEYALITMGQIDNGEKREKIYELLLRYGYQLPAIISPLAHIARNAKIGEGSIIMHGAIINACAIVGANCIINTKSLIEHDVLVEDHCHISTAVTVNGGSIIAANSFIGSNAVIIQNVTVAKNSFIKANQVYKG